MSEARVKLLTWWWTQILSQSGAETLYHLQAPPSPQTISGLSSRFVSSAKP